MIVHGYVKQCKNVISTWVGGDFIMFFKVSQLDGPLQKNYQNIKTHN